MKRLHRAIALLSTLSLFWATQAAAQPSPSDAAPATVDQAAAAAKAEATERYKRGRLLHDEKKEWDKALVEFLASRELYPSWSATYGAALCLTQLGRHDEALETLEGMLREFSEKLPPKVKQDALARTDELRRQVGILEVGGAEPGALITVDGRRRGEFPLPALRLTSGSHWVRVYKDGFEPFETRAEIAGDRIVRVDARLHALIHAGRLHVSEQHGRSLDVIADGTVVGKTPWAGQLAPGEHVVFLRGEDHLGTPPLEVQVELDRTVPLTLAAEALVSALRVEPVPANATIAMDGITLGRGMWEGRLRAGVHHVEIAAPGFVSESRRLALKADQTEVLRAELERDPSSPFWRKPSRPARFVLEVHTNAVIIPTLGGDVANACIRDCEKGLGAGAVARVHGGYELGMGLGFGITAGFLAVEQPLLRRSTTLAPVGLAPSPGTIDDHLRLRGGVFGAWIGFTLAPAQRVPIHVRVGAGGVVGSLMDARSHGSFQANDGSRYALRELGQDQRAAFIYVTPEAHAGLMLTELVEVTVGIGVPILVSLRQPRWDPSLGIAGPDGLATFPADALVGRVAVGIAPGIGVRYDFF